MRVLRIFLLTFLFSCNNLKQDDSKHTLNFGKFTIQVPKNWKPVEMEGLDSYIGAIAAEKHDTIYFDLGRYSNSLEEYIKISEDDTTYFATKNFDGLIVKGDSLFIDSLVKNKIQWTTIDGHASKIVYPKKRGHGTTGVYVDSLWKLGNDQIRFTLQGVDLTPQSESILLESIKTLKFTSK